MQIYSLEFYCHNIFFYQNISDQLFDSPGIVHFNTNKALQITNEELGISPPPLLV